MVELKYKVAEKGKKKDMSYKYLMLSTVVPEKAEKVSEKYNNIFSIIEPYQKYVTDQKYKNVKKLLKSVRVMSDLSDFSIVYRKGLLKQDFYFWTGYLHGFNYDWDDRTNSIKPFSLVFFDLDINVINKKGDVISHYTRIYNDFYKDSVKIMNGKNRIIVDLNYEKNAFFLGYVLKKIPWSWARKYIRIKLPNAIENETVEIKPVCEVFFRDVCYTSPLQKLIYRMRDFIRNIFHVHGK